MTRKSPLPADDLTATTTPARAERSRPRLEEAITKKRLLTLQGLSSAKFAGTCSVLVRMVPEEGGDISLPCILLDFLAAMHRTEREGPCPVLKPLIEAVSQIDAACPREQRLTRRVDLLARIQRVRESELTPSAYRSPA